MHFGIIQWCLKTLMNKIASESKLGLMLSVIKIMVYNLYAVLAKHYYYSSLRLQCHLN